MPLHSHFKNLTLSPDQETALQKLEAFLYSPTQVFMLKGYAGSGKTTILRGLVAFLKEIKKDFVVTAPTGRAAKVLRDKTGQGTTIHSTIYDFKNLKTINADSGEVADHSFKYIFPIAKILTDEQIIIVDEASMISNTESKNELFTFGTDNLLQDLLTYTQLKTSKSKIIFVGDPAQLPPVTDNNSHALTESFFAEKGLSLVVTELETVMRQKDNLIYRNSIRLRKLLNEAKRNELKFDYDGNSFIKINSQDIPQRYTELYPIPELNNSVVIVYSNSQALAYNRAIREKYFHGHQNLLPGDILLINNNNYHTYGVALFNGDMAKVINVSETTTTQSAPVMVDIGGAKVRKIFTLTFRDITIRIPNFDGEITCKIIDSLLNSPEKDLDNYGLKALYINFVIRFNEKQQKNRDEGLLTFKVGSEEFKNELKSDPYVNALRVKYGYAITCHKSQGGEWETIFVDYFGRVGFSDSQLRWCYTATTRAIKTCYTANAPDFGPVSKLNFGKIITINNFPGDALFLKNVPLSPFHTENQHRCKSLKYWDTLKILEPTQYSIVRVSTLGPYHERYFITQGTIDFFLDSYHNDAGFFKPVTANTNTEEVNLLLAQLNVQAHHDYSIDYVPSTVAFGRLFSLIQGFCNDMDITITNIKESVGQYFITYYLATSGKCSYIQFYFKENGQFTTAMPKSDIGENDDKLKLLIAKLIAHAS